MSRSAADALKRTPHGPLPMQSSLSASSSSASTIKAPSPRGTSRRNPSGAQSSGPSQYHLRAGGAGSNSAFGPPRRADADDQEVAEREKQFLQPGSARDQNPHFPTHGSASEYDFGGEGTFELVPGTRGNSPNASISGPFIRPRVKNATTFSASQGAAGDAASSQSMDIAAPYQQQQQHSSRPGSPATTTLSSTRPSSPTTIRQQASPQLGSAVRGPSPIANTGIPSRPASPPQLAPIRGRSGSLEGKVTVQPVPIKTTHRPLTPTSGFVPAAAGPVAGQTKAKAVVSGPPGAVSSGIRSQTNNSFRPATGSSTAAPSSRPMTPSTHPPGSSPTGIIFPNEVVAAFARGDLSGLSDEHLDMVLNLSAITKERRRSNAPLVQQTVNSNNEPLVRMSPVVGSISSSTMAPPAAKPPHHKDSLEEGTTPWDVSDEFFARQQMLRGGSMDGGRQVPGDKFFENHQQIPGEESRAERASKPPSPHPWYSNPHSTRALPKEDGSLFKAQPQMLDEALVGPPEAVPDRSRATNLVSHGSAFSEHHLEDWDDDDPLTEG